MRTPISASSFAASSSRWPARYCDAASSRCLIDLRTSETKPASSTSEPRRMRSFLISVRSSRKVESFSFSPAFRAAFTSVSIRCCGAVVVMTQIIGGRGLRRFLRLYYHFAREERYAATPRHPPRHRGRGPPLEPARGVGHGPRPLSGAGDRHCLPYAQGPGDG